MTTPYALFAHVPLSECRSLWQSWVRAENHDTDARERWRYAMEVRYGRRALAAVSNQLKLVTAERDALRREMDAMRGEL